MILCDFWWACVIWFVALLNQEYFARIWWIQQNPLDFWMAERFDIQNFHVPFSFFCRDEKSAIFLYSICKLTANIWKKPNLNFTHKISSCVNKYSIRICSYSGRVHSMRYSTTSAILMKLFLNYSNQIQFQTSVKKPKSIWIISNGKCVKHQNQNCVNMSRMTCREAHAFHLTHWLTLIVAMRALSVPF